MKVLIKSLTLFAIATSIISCGGLAPIADPDDEDGSPPVFVLNVKGPGLNVNIKSEDACPPDGVINEFGSLYLQLPSDREYSFIYTVSDAGGVSQTRISSNDTTLINFEVEVPDRDRVSYSPPASSPAKTAFISRGAELRTAVLASGKLYPLGSGTSSIALDGFDAGSNNTFRTLTIVIGPGLDPELIERACP